MRRAISCSSQPWGETLGGLAPVSRARKLGAVKSLAAFGHRIGYLAFDIGAPLRLPSVKTPRVDRHRAPVCGTSMCRSRTPD